MYITLDILQRRGACQEYLDFFAKHYPEGVEMLDMIERGHMPYHGLHWGYQYLDPNEEEIAAYWKKVCVENSEGIHESDHIYNSTIVSGSTQIKNSEYIYRSKEVNNSEQIADSEFVDNSEQIGISSFIDNSERVVKGKNVTNSNEVYDSEYVINSEGIFKSNNVANGHGIWHGRNITNCGFCFGCADLSNALFCQDIRDGEYMLFNKPIDKLRFDMIYKQFERFKPSIVLLEEWPSNMGYIPRSSYDYRKHFVSVPESFWAWAKTLPGYNSDILYSITFNPLFLK